jgi:hypothetical protein
MTFWYKIRMSFMTFSQKIIILVVKQEFKILVKTKQAGNSPQIYRIGDFC